MAHLRQKREENDQGTLLHLTGNPNDCVDCHDQICQIGSKVKVKWTIEEIGDSGWRAGWYTAYVQAYEEETDTVTLQYPIEPGCTYTMEVTPTFQQGRIQLVKAVL